MKKIISIVLAMTVAMTLVACGGASTAKMTMGTGGTAGTYYGYGGVLGQYIKNKAGIDVTVVSTDGSKANIQGIAAGDYQLGTVQSDVMAYAYNGTSLFEGAPVEGFSTVAALYMEQVQIVTLDPEIKTVADLAGKKVSIGAAGSGVYFNAIDILGVYGLTEADIVPTYQGFGDSANALKDGQIDAAFVVAGAPTTAITDLATTKDVHLVALDDEHVAKLLETSPYYAKNVISADTYTGLDGDVTTVAVGAVVLAANTVSEDAVYALCADIFDNAADLVSSHAKYGELIQNLENVEDSAGQIADFALEGQTVAQQIEMLAGLCKADADRAMQSLFSPDRMTWMLILPDGSADMEEEEDEAE